MSEREFQASSFEYIALSFFGYLEKKKQDLEEKRTMVFLTSAQNYPKGTTAQKMWPLPWDKKGVNPHEWIEQNKEKFDKLTLD